jgi:Transposase IS4
MAQLMPSTAYTIIMDNYFTSCKVFRRLYALGFHAVGMLKGRSDVPKSLLWKKTAAGRPTGAAKALRSTDHILGVVD